MKKKLCMLMALLMVCLSAAACAETIELKVWSSQPDQALLEELCNAFAAEHPENEWKFTYGVVGEADAQARYLEDPAAAADVFSYPDDQIIKLVKADALYEVTRNRDQIIAENSAGAINAATYDGVLYGYPMTADNGYFLYYDKSVLTEEDVQTLDGILAAAEKAGKKFNMNVADGWYLASFFLGNGCQLTLDADGKQICDFNNEKGLAAAEAIKALCDHPAFLAGGQDLLQGSIGDTICAGICGTWISSAVKEKLGDNYAACKLPTFTCGGEQVQMGSFLGCKILGVNTQTAHPVEAMELAEYLTNEQSQLRRFEVLGYGPSNVNVAASEVVASEPALAALAAQSAYAISQHVLGGYWTPAGAFGAELVAHNGSDLQAILDQRVPSGRGEKKPTYAGPLVIYLAPAPDFLAERKFSREKPIQRLLENLLEKRRFLHPPVAGGDGQRLLSLRPDRQGTAVSGCGGAVLLVFLRLWLEVPVPFRHLGRKHAAAGLG